MKVVIDNASEPRFPRGWLGARIKTALQIRRAKRTVACNGKRMRATAAQLDALKKRFAKA